MEHANVIMVGKDTDVINCHYYQQIKYLDIIHKIQVPGEDVYFQIKPTVICIICFSVNLLIVAVSTHGQQIHKLFTQQAVMDLIVNIHRLLSTDVYAN